MELYKVTARSQALRMARYFYDTIKTSMNGEEDLHMSHLVIGPIRAELERRSYTLALLGRERDENSPCLPVIQHGSSGQHTDSPGGMGTLSRRHRPFAVIPGKDDILKRASELQSASSSGCKLSPKDEESLGSSSLMQNLEWTWSCTGCGQEQGWRRTTPGKEGFDSHSYLSLDREYFRCSCGAWAVNMKNKQGRSLVRSALDKSGNVRESEGRWPSMRITCLIAAWTEGLRTVIAVIERNQR